jgi:WD40 repeat protein
MVKFWNSSDLSSLAGSQQRPAGQVWKLAYSDHTNTVATADNDGAVRLYKPLQPRLQVHGNHGNTVVYIAFADSSILSFDVDGKVDIFDPVGLKEKIVEMPGIYQSGIRTVRFHSVLKTFVTGYDLSYQRGQNNGQITCWDPRVPDTIKSCVLTEPVAYVACHPSMPIAAFVTKAGSVGLRSLPDLQPIGGLNYAFVNPPDGGTAAKIA